MLLERTRDTLHKDIICEHKFDDYGGDFFHNHNGYELFLFVNGCVNYYVEQQGRRMVRGCLVCIKPYDFHRRELQNMDHYERVIINIREPVMYRLSNTETNLAECFHRLPNGCMNVIYLTEIELTDFLSLATLLSQELSSKEFGSDLLIESYIRQILIQVNRYSQNTKRPKPKNIMPKMVRDTMVYIEKHITESISLDILSNEIHHNGTYISRRFKDITGLSLQHYIIKKRITIAKSYLGGGYSPSDACFLSGFNDYSNFSRTFTNQVGISPKKYQLQEIRQKGTMLE